MTCNSCIHFGLCRLENETPARCQHFMPNIVHCIDCVSAVPVEKHADLFNPAGCLHCLQWRGTETRNVWHKYKKYYRDYSLVDLYDFCSHGEKI